MASALDLVNRALVRLGAEKVASLDYEDSPNAATAKDLYDSVRDALLSEHPWSFATRRLPLSKLDVEPDPGEWSFQYALPNKALRIWRVTDKSGTQKSARYALGCDDESGYRRLYSSCGADFADITMVSDEELFPAYFQEALVARLAAELAMPITRRTDIAAYFEGKAVPMVSRAKTADWNERPTPELDDGHILADAKWG